MNIKQLFILLLENRQAAAQKIQSNPIQFSSVRLFFDL